METYVIRTTADKAARIYAAAGQRAPAMKPGACELRMNAETMAKALLTLKLDGDEEAARELEQMNKARKKLRKIIPTGYTRR